jgi:hypothetical protein
MLSQPGKDSVPSQLAAELHAERAAWLSKRGRSAEEDIREGLTRVEEALSKNPHNPDALLAKGQLHLARVRTTREQQARTEAGLRAREAFEAALRINPLLTQETADVLNEIEQLSR